jgi:hypothetical protein
VPPDLAHIEQERGQRTVEIASDRRGIVRIGLAFDRVGEVAGALFLSSHIRCLPDAAGRSR